MECSCEQNIPYELIIEGDMGGDPIWCSHCGSNLDIDEISISEGLKEELWDWMTRYGEWIDWDKDKLLPNGIEFEVEHNRQGMELTEKAKKELEGKHKIKFSPSTSARRYANARKFWRR
ncbi:hypothetical protein RRU94_22185 [Domibacillus sp. DTU_2020_1001157_1_SI_ALB_TIR_016]|uniref:hypothetical protein n=1 Tax=Domibacillus sp. DTU_2020_1001157_1_SI_ALB_TIR_016 TaxID=3077789 RepID=UPI0028E99C0D|nr:hypothetical protein [Domibacillus sp. DTU_2020_1001157_1_SI_ALB_TIR_016]WNS82453.1 hypothetical protein RRU94_22185 [Domibacillus sp. DTU_2020_1001157_1_SI_ALB_TIR_016]